MKGRNIEEVIDQMLAVTPSDSALRPRLEWLKRDASYKAPEQMPEVWAQGGEILGEEFEPPSQVTGWQAEVAAIWTGAALSCPHAATERRSQT